MAIAYFSIGSNLGDRYANLRTAIAALQAAHVRLTRQSSIYETEPVDFTEQPWFLNCVLEAETDLSPNELLTTLQGIERRIGRTPSTPKGPRLIDLDILLYGSETIARPELQIPHPRLPSRRFVLVPLAEIAPNLTHPKWHHATAAQLLAQTSDQSAVTRFTPSNHAAQPE